MKRGTDGVRVVDIAIVVTAGRRKTVRPIRIIVVAGAQPSEDSRRPPL